MILGLAALGILAGAVPAMAQNVDHRAQKQELRIKQGEKSGALSRGKSAKLQHREMRLHRTEARMRWRDGGKLNPRQKERLARMEKHDSRAIYRLKHNDRRG